MMASTPRVGRFMTPCLHTINQDLPLERAHELMRAHGIRHLPVLADGKLVGMLSSRDLYLIETLRDVDPASVTVDEAMSQTPYVVAVDAPLEEVATAMAAHHDDCAVVTDGHAAVGIFTALDAMRALATILARERLSAQTVFPSRRL